MPATQRSPAPGVIDQLLAEPYRAEFFQAVSLIELWLQQNGVERDRARLDFLRFPNRVALSFPPSQIEALVAVADVPIHDSAALLAALRDKRLRHIRITPAFMGFLGSNGTLPLHYTRRIAQHEHDTGDGGPRALLDLFSHRSVTLFYQAWTRHRPEHMRDAEGRDQLLPILLAYAGMLPRTPHGDDTGAPPRAPHGDDAQGIAEETIAFYAAQFRSRAVSGGVLAGVLSEYFGVPFALEQFAGSWRAIPPEQCARLGLRNTSLAAGMVLGTRVYCRDARVRLHIGPLDQERFERFIPGGGATRALNQILGLFCGAGLAFEVHVALRRPDVRGMRLSARGGTRVGIGAFLLNRPATSARDGAIYLLHP